MDSNLTAFVERTRAGQRVHIRQDVDAKFRKGLLEAVRSAGGESAKWLIWCALENGPSKGGIADAIKYFGFKDTNDPRLVATAGIVDGLEISMPGFKKWLEMTGFGNDKMMLRGFIAWAEHVNGLGKLSPAAAEVYEDAKNQG
jgi:hypothetical protein